jgi:hypothetical protein
MIHTSLVNLIDEVPQTAMAQQLELVVHAEAHFANDRG